MKIDPTLQGIVNLENDRVKGSQSGGVSSSADTKPGSSTTAAGGDTVQFSSRHGEVQQLTAQATSGSDVRLSKIQPLQSLVESGSYNPNSQKIANAFLSEHVARSAGA